MFAPLRLRAPSNLVFFCSLQRWSERRHTKSLNFFRHHLVEHFLSVFPCSPLVFCSLPHSSSPCSCPEVCSSSTCHSFRTSWSLSRCPVHSFLSTRARNVCNFSVSIRFVHFILFVFSQQLLLSHRFGICARTQRRSKFVLKPTMLRLAS